MSAKFAAETRKTFLCEHGKQTGAVSKMRHHPLSEILYRVLSIAVTPLQGLMYNVV